MIFKIPFTEKLLIIQKPRLPRFIITKIPKYQVYGLTNRTEDGHWLVFLDYDNVEDMIVRQDISRLQKGYKLGTAIIRMSNQEYQKNNKSIVGSYHVIFFSKLSSYKKMFEIINSTRCDNKFKRAYFQQRVKVLRLSRKGNKKEPLPYMVLPAKTIYNTSRATAQLFENIDKIKIIKYLNNLDSSEGVELINYVTA